MKFGFRQLMMLVILMWWPVEGAAAPATPSSRAVLSATDSTGDGAVTLLSNVAGMLDGFGRPTFFRLTFQSAAGVGPEDLPSPFIAYVESGSFVYRDPASTYTDVEVGAFITTSLGDDYAIRTPTLKRGTLLVVSLPGSCYQAPDFACDLRFLPYDFLCDTPCRPDITNTLLFNHQDLKLRYMNVSYTFQYTMMVSGEEYTPVDPGGDGETIYMLGRVDVGTVQSSTGEVYNAGQTFIVSPDQGLMSIGPEDAMLFVLRVAKVS